MSATAPLRPNVAAKSGRIGHLRWYICGLLFYATTVNYMDRQVLGLLKPVIARELGWSESDYSSVVFGFQLAYALMMPIAGRIIDWLGTRLGYTLAVVVWSLAAMSHAAARSTLGFIAARFALGLGEAANFPAAIKTVADWFPKRERALATGIFNSGSNIGALIAPLLVPFVAAHFGWRMSFLATGALDLLWIVLWLTTYRAPREHKRLSEGELALIESDQAEEPPRKVPYPRLLKKRPAWAFLIGKFLTDPIWWFYLFWLPGFLNLKYGLDLQHLGPPLVAIYLAADFGSIGGGWISSHLLARGYTVTKARKMALFLCALAVTPVACVMFTGGSLWLTVAIIGLATAAHQGWSANLFTLVSDTFPRAAVGSVVGLGGCGGAIGGMLVAKVIGYWLDFSHNSYGPLFFGAGVTYLLAFLIIHLLLPRLEKADV
jgi:MFS transporter, ACS family, hexuronate transporter